MRFRSLLTVGVALALLCAAHAFAGTISTFTGPGGINPALSPQNLQDYNAVINGVNSNAAFAGTTTPSTVIGATAFTSTKLSPNPSNLLELVGNQTSTTGTTTCNITGASGCIPFVDNAGALRWLPFY